MVPDGLPRFGVLISTAHDEQLDIMMVETISKFLVGF